jgi:hypothetical protein
MILKNVRGPRLARSSLRQGRAGLDEAREDLMQEVPLSWGRKEMFHNISYANRGTGGRTRALDRDCV